MHVISQRKDQRLTFLLLHPVALILTRRLTSSPPPTPQETTGEVRDQSTDLNSSQPPDLAHTGAEGPVLVDDDNACRKHAPYWRKLTSVLGKYAINHAII